MTNKWKHAHADMVVEEIDRTGDTIVYRVMEMNGETLSHEANIASTSRSAIATFENAFEPMLTGEEHVFDYEEEEEEEEGLPDQDLNKGDLAQFLVTVKITDVISTSSIASDLESIDQSEYSIEAIDLVLIEHPMQVEVVEPGKQKVCLVVAFPAEREGDVERALRELGLPGKVLESSPAANMTDELGISPGEDLVERLLDYAEGKSNFDDGDEEL